MSNVKIIADNYCCTGCGRCELFCPYGHISLKNGDLGFPVPFIEECKDCGECVKSCPWSDEYSDDEE